MNADTKLFWAQLDFLTMRRLKILRRYFGDLETAKEHFSEAEFLKAGIPRRSVTALIKKQREMNFRKIQKKFEESEATLLFLEDGDFPESLKNISDSPIFLFIQGEILPEDLLSLSVVGTRRCSAHGKQCVHHVLPDIIHAGFTIVSGMARGIDSLAHQEALARGGRTIAVWGTGIDRVYPEENKALAHKIREQGAIISEFPLGTEPNNYNFPRRNRLISGLSLGTLVIEGKDKSGSLITAHLALEQGKEVFAVPGSPFLPLSEATNRLIKKGEAKLVQTSDDILEEFEFVHEVEKKPLLKPENKLEEIICGILTKEPLAFDELVIQASKPSHELSSALTVMAMKGMVRDLGMNQWAKSF